MNLTVKQWLASVAKRALELVVKLLSVKGLVFGVATWLTLQGKLTAEYWLVASSLLIGGRELEKYLKLKLPPTDTPGDPTQGIVG